MEQAEWVFVGRQVERREATTEELGGSSWASMVLEVEVLTVYKGDVPEFVELRTGAGGADCGVNLGGWPSVGLALTPGEDGTLRIASCAGGIRADAITYLFETLPEPMGTGPPSFVLGLEIGSARIALLDDWGDVLAYGGGDGRLAAVAACPGGQKAVEIVERDHFGEVERDRPSTVEVRDLTTLEIVWTAQIPDAPRDRSPLNGRTWVFDLTCHDQEGETISYLIPEGRWDSLSGSNLPGPGILHLWSGGELVDVKAGKSRAVAVDLGAGVFYSLIGDKGTRLQVRDLSGEILEVFDVPLGHVGWRLALSDDGEHLAILSRDRPMARENWFFAEVNSLLVMERDSREVTTHSLPGAGFAKLLATTGDGSYVAAVAQDVNSDITSVYLISDGGVTLLGSVPGSGFRDMVAVGSETIIAEGPEHGFEPDTEVRLDIATGDISVIDGLLPSSVAGALRSDASVQQIPDPARVSTTTSVVDAADRDPVAPFTTSPTAAPSAATSSPPETTPSDSPAGPSALGEHSDRSAAWWVAIAVAVVPVLGGAATWIIYRRSRRGA